MTTKTKILWVILGFISGCVDPYVAKLSGYESLIVVDALLIDGEEPSTVRLSRSFQNQNEPPMMVIGAEVSITDGNGNQTILMEYSPGNYKTDTSNFIGVVGQTYTLRIQTAEGKSYESEASTLGPVPNIDNIYYTYDREFTENGSREMEGLRIYLDTESGPDICKYFKWDFEETWKFQIPYPPLYEYINMQNIIPIEIKNNICWRTEENNDIILTSSDSYASEQIERMPICFIGSEESNRLLIQYSILVKQYSLSLTDYEYWRQLKQINESGGDIFNTQPFLITGNIHSTTQPDEIVLGYFQVSAVKKLRKYITASQLSELNIPVYNYPCTLISKGPSDYEAPTPSLDEIYERHISQGLVFVAPDDADSPERLIFTTPYCTDCTISGDTTRPAFWIDLD